MDTGINMLGQFQGDSSLGLGSFQESSEPSLEFSSLEDRSLSNPFGGGAGEGLSGGILSKRSSHLEVHRVGWFAKYDIETPEKQKEIDDLVE